MRIISIMNQKGGCGKTTTAINLSAFLAKFGSKVLLIDLDPQGHASAGFNIREDQIESGLFDVFTRKVSLEKIIKRQVYSGLDIAPATIQLSAIEQYLSRSEGREKQLHEHIESLKPSSLYDYIIIDCPPQLGLLVFNALIASGEVIVPIEPSAFSFQGIERLLETIELIGETAAHPLKVMALPTVYSPQSRYSRSVLKGIGERFQALTLKSVIRQNVKLKEAAQKGVPILNYDPNAIGSKDYQNLALEIIQKEEPGFTRTDLDFNGEQRIASVEVAQAEKNAEILLEEIGSLFRG